MRKDFDTITKRVSQFVTHEAQIVAYNLKKPDVQRRIGAGTAIAIIICLTLSGLLNFLPLGTQAASYTGRQMRTVEYVLGTGGLACSGTNNACGSDNSSTARATNVPVYFGNQISTTKGTASTKNILIQGTNIDIERVYVEGYIQIVPATSITNFDVRLDVEGSSTAGTDARLQEATGPTYYDTSGLNASVKYRAEATSFFTRQASADWNAGLSVVGAYNVVGPTQANGSMKLVITYSQDYITTDHTETKTVRFPLDSNQASANGSQAAACAAADTTTCNFDYNADIEDSGTTIRDVYFNITAETNSATAPAFAAQITGGTASPSFSAIETVAGQSGMNIVFRPANGGSDFLANTAQTLEINNGAVALQGLGGELVVTYDYATGTATQTETIRQFVRQETAQNPGTGESANTAASVTVSNSGFSMKNIWVKAEAPVTDTNTLTLKGDVNGAVTSDGNADITNAVALGGADTIRSGDADTVYLDLSGQASEFSSATTSIDIERQYSSATGDAPVGFEIFLTFTWNASAGGTVTKTITFGAGQQGIATTASTFRNRTVELYLSEVVTKTYRSAYVVTDVLHSDATSIVDSSTISVGVDNTTAPANQTTVTEQQEEGAVNVTEENTMFTVLHDIGSTVFSAGTDITWKERAFRLSATTNQAEEAWFSHEVVVTYDAALSPIALSQNHYRWRDDTTALNTDGGWAANLDTKPTISKSTTYRVRLEVANTGTAPANQYPYRLEFGTNPSTCSAASYAAVPVTATTEHFEMVGSGQYTDEASLSASRLTATGTFTNGRGVEDPSNNSNAITINGGYYTEIEYAIQATTNATDGGNYCFRLTNLGSTTNLTYTTYAEAQIGTSSISISGTCDQFDQTTDCTDAGAEVIAVAFGGTLQGQTDGTVDGAWEITGLTAPAANTIITVFIDGEATANERAVAVTKYSGTGNIGGVTLYQRHLVIGSDQNNEITNANLASYDYSASGSDVDIIHEVDANNDLTIDNLGNYTDEELHVLAGDTYRPDSTSSGNVTTVAVDNNGTFTADGNTFNVGGDWTNNLTFNANTSTVNFNGSGTQTIGGSATTTFNNLATANTANATTGIATNIAGTLVVGNGSTFTNAGHAMTVTGTTTVGGGTSGSLVISNSAGTKTFNGLVTTAAGSTWNNSGGSAVTFHGGITNNATATFTAGAGVHTFDTSSQVITGTIAIPSVTVTGVTLTNGAGSVQTLTIATALSGTGGLTQAANATLSLGGTSGITTLTATASPNTVNYTGAGQTVRSNNYHHLTLSGSGTDVLQSGTTAIAGDFTLSGTVATSGVVGLTIAGNVVLGNGTAFTAGAYTHNVAGNWTNNGTTFTNTGSTINFNGAGTKTIGGSATTTFNNLATANTANATTGIATNIAGTLVIGNGSTFTNAGHAMTVTGTTTVGGGTSGSLVISNSAGTKTFNGLVTTAAGSTWNNSGGSAVTFHGGITNNATATFTAGAGVHTFDTSTQALNGTLNIPNVTVNNPTILTNNGTLTVSTALSGTQELINTGTLNIGGTSGIAYLNADASGTVDYYGSSQTVNVTLNGYNNLTLSGSGTKTLQAGTTQIYGDLTFAGTASATGVVGLTVGGNVILGNGTAFTAGAYTHNVAGNWSNNGATFTATGSTINFDGAGTQTLNSGGVGAGKFFNNLNHSGSGTLRLLTNAIDVNGAFSQTAGIFDSNSLSQNFADSFSLSSGTTYTKGGTLTFDGTGASIFTDSTASKQDMGTVVIDGSGRWLPLGSNILVTTVTVGADDYFDISDYTLTIAGSGTPFVVNSGGDVTYANSTVVYAGTSATNIATQDYNNLTLTPASGTPTYSLTGNLTGANSLTGNLTINTGVTLDTTGTNYNIALAGNWVNAGSFTANSSAVTFNATTSGRTIDTGGTGAGKTFYDVFFDSATGGWTIQNNNMKITRNLGMTDVSSWTLANGLTLEVDGIYAIADAETAATTWTGSTLYLNSGTSYTVGSKTQSTETYGTLQIGASTDIRMWQSSAATYTVDASGSLYSMDHANVDGDAYIWGDFHTNTNDYWNYATDFDGSTISGGTPTVETFSSPTSSSWQVPAGITSVTVLAWGGGGNGGLGDQSGNPGGGGGGGAFTTHTLTGLTPGSNINYLVGAAEQDSWFSSSTTVKAVAGHHGSDLMTWIGDGLGGLAANCIPSSGAYSGGNGGNDYGGGGGGGGAGSGGAGSSATGGTGGSGGIGGSLGYPGGAGGSFGPNNGLSPSGGGSGEDGNGYGAGSGAAGKIIISYSAGGGRQVNVKVDPSAKVTIDSGKTLEAIGTSGNHTTISRQGASGGYDMEVNGGTINIDYVNFDYLDGNLGLNIKAGSTVTDLKNSAFANQVVKLGTDSFITVDTSVIGSNIKNLVGNSFSMASGLDKNVSVTGADVTGFWIFGTTNGEADDWNRTTSANEFDRGMLRWNDSTVASIFRSVGPSATGSLATGTSNSMSVSGTTVTFNSSVEGSNAVGVGDAILYDSDNGGNIDSIAFISARTSGTQFTLQSTLGEDPTPTTASDNDWAIFRAHTSLYNAERGVENSGISTFLGTSSGSLANFDDWTPGGDATSNDGGRNLVTYFERWNIAGYANGTTADSASVTVDGWTTGLEKYIRVFTPTQLSEVATSQRHAGVWDDSSYHMEVTDVGIRTYEDNFRLEGVQVFVNSGATDIQGVDNFGAGTADYRVSGSIFKGSNGNVSGEYNYGIRVCSTGGSARVWNNIVYDFIGTGSTSGGLGVCGSYVSSTTTSYVFNNTAYNNTNGIWNQAGGSPVNIYKNILSYANTDNYEGPFDSASTNNLSGPSADTEIPPTGKQDGVTVTFANAGARDLHLNSSDTGAVDNGANLYNDSNLAFQDDIDAEDRGGSGYVWDVGADEMLITNTAPTTPNSLFQKKVTGGATLATGDWTNENQVQFTATTTDPDVGDTLYLCVETDTISTALSSTNGGDLCGTGVPNSSPGVATAVSVTISGLSDGSEYHWQVQAKDAATVYSGWAGYGSNTENPPTNPAARDFGVDTSAPAGGNVKDGQTSGADLDWNVDGSLTTLLANWTGTAPDAAASGLAKYEFALRRQSDNYYWTPGSPGSWTIGQYWYDNGTSTSFTENGLNLSTGTVYYVTLRTTDNAGNNASINSNGIQVTPTLSFTIGSNTVNFDLLSNGNNWTNTKTTTVTTSTNAAGGYTVKGYVSDYMRSLAYVTQTIADFAGTWTTPQDWTNFCKDDANDCGFGYTSNDTTIQAEGNKFLTGTLYSQYQHSAPGDVLADHTAAINGSTGAVSNEQFTIAHKVSVPASQTATKYQTVLTILCTANF